ncbi:MAG: thiamine phosphate synthase [Methylobacter sp.]|uniref:thiamine phosphate synthase n=1 Tax=Methylobacter sp. TaxID=2051955 RepID=UPI0027303F9E|nr:thiamine phosphate synthase [Methylobacter sp.]MDP1663859.1 thiamine phosphate synthase [Methylobacter sp.]MDP1971307.1 thiamine phosphate synthase [Methylobacter sp.]
MNFPASGLYAITQTGNKSGDIIINEVAAAIKGGAVIVQYRDKNPLDAPFLARELVKICHQHNVPLLINDDIELAALVGADGVHLGREDGAVTQARKLLGEDAIIGVSCYNFVEQAVAAQTQGATYAAFGRFFPSSSKPLAAPARIETLRQAKRVLTIPIVAIGGILPDNGAQLLAAGADLLAVIGGVFDHQPEQSARAYKALFSR